MNQPADFSSFVRRLFPEAGPEMVRLYASAAQNANLLHTDFYTIRDLLDLSGYSGEEAVHALLLAMVLALDEGNGCIDVSARALSRQLIDLDGGEMWANRICAGLEDTGFGALIGTTVEDNRPIILHRRGAKKYLYFQKYLKHELLLQAELQKRLQTGAAAPALDALPAALQQVSIEAPLLVHGRPLQLDRDQQLALGASLLRNFVIISGGPGTGKTALVFTLVRCLVRCGFTPERIALAAPTGRAAQRLTDALHNDLGKLAKPADDSSPDSLLERMSAHTLHHLLRYHPARGIFRHHAENPLPADVVIVDEVSMVGVVLMAKLFQALLPQTKLILLGDKDQLPSVDAGAVFASLVDQGGNLLVSTELSAQMAKLWPGLELPSAVPPHPLRDVVVLLRENYRSEPRIREAAEALNRQEIEIVERLPAVAMQKDLSFAKLEEQGGCWLLDQGEGSIREWRGALEQWAQHHYLTPTAQGPAYMELAARCRIYGHGDLAAEQQGLLEKLFLSLGRARILTLLREGPWGCEDINRFLAQYLQPQSDRHGRGTHFAGEPVLISSNDPGRGLFNGDVGITLRSQEGGYRVVFQRRGSYISFPAEALMSHELAFAITVHKSQGSEHDQVLLVLPPEWGRRLLTKEMVYTGITRARQLAVICSRKEVLRSAIKRKMERESGVMEFGTS